LIVGGISPKMMVSRRLMAVKIVPTMQAVKKALRGIVAEVAKSINSFIACNCISFNPDVNFEKHARQSPKFIYSPQPLE